MENMLSDLGAVETPAVETPQIVDTPTVETPQVQTPQADPPIVDTPAQDEVLSLNDEQPTVTPLTPQLDLTPTLEIDKGAILKEFFGTTDAESIKTKLAELETMRGEMEKPRYQSKFAEYIDNLVAKHGDPKTQADIFKKTIDVLTTDVDSLDEKTALAFQLKQEYPSLSEDEINDSLEGRYGLGEFATDEQKKFGAVQLKMDAQKAKLNIKQMQADAFKDVPSRQAALKQVDEEKRVNDWKPKAQEVAKAINSFEFEVEKGKKMKFDIPQNDKAMLAERAEAIAINSGLIPDAKNAEQIQEIVKMEYVYQNAQKLISNAYRKGLSQANAEWAQKVNNPSALKNTAGGTDFVQNKSAQDQMVDWIASQAG